MWVAGFTLFLLGIIFIIIYRSIKKKHTRCSAQTQGVLREIRNNTSDDSSVGRKEYLYSYTVNGIEYLLKTFDGSPQTNDVGDICTIRYNPARPKDALAHYYESLKAFRILFIGGIALVPVGFLLFMFGLAR